MEVVRNINKALKKNRLILMTLANGNKSSYVSRDELLKKGFDFDYITRKSSLSDGNQINIVYDFCYYSMGNNSFKISNIKSYNQLVS